jgi:DNA-directed RNA polymerase subunit RPC12/RpoP
MSTNTTYTCDRCKKVEPFNIDLLFLRSMFAADGSWDLCSECKEKFLAFMKKKPYTG